MKYYDDNDSVNKYFKVLYGEFSVNIKEIIK